MYADRRYQFSARVSAVPQWGGAYSIALDRPRVLRVLDRRRFLRANLAPSSKVRLDWPDARGRHSQSASLLNISADGMACRISEGVGVGIERHTCLKATFEMPGRDKPFELEAVVTNKTPASEGCTILGLQFVTARRDARVISELRIAIEGGQAAGSPVEVCA
jgi:c-di-GMP-binding flagellar brake protein YcgR